MVVGIYTIESGLGTGIGTHGVSSFKRCATADVHDDPESALAHVRQHSLNQTQGAEVDRLHLSADLVLRESFHRSVDGKAGIVHQDIDLLAGLLEVFDHLGAVGAVDVQLKPFAAFALNLRNELGRARGVP